MSTRHMLLAASLLIVSRSSAQIPPFIGQEEATLTAPDGDTADFFGFSAAIEGDTAVLGAWKDDHAGAVDAGAVYVFVRAGQAWAFQTKLIARDASPGSKFGYRVAMSGDTVLVGARDDDAAGSGAGAAYVFTRSGESWSQQAKLLASDAQPGDQFGSAVAIDGETAVVGARSRGSAYVFFQSGSTWSEQDKLTASDAAPGDNFGGSVGLEADTIVVGAKDHDTGGLEDAGAAYIFVRAESSWSQEAKLIAADASSTSRFGKSVALSGDSLLVGANGDGTLGVGDSAGSAYVFVRAGSTWDQQDKLTAPVPLAGEAFGSNVSLQGDTALASGRGLDDTGAIYVFSREGTTWSYQTVLLASDGESGDTTSGVHAGLSDDVVVVGIPADDHGGFVNVGSAYVFRLETIGTWAGLGGGTPGIHGVPRLVGEGYLTPSSTLTLTLTDAAPLALAGLFISLSSNPAPFVGGTLHAFPFVDLVLLNTNFGEIVGSGVLPADLAPGTDIFFQYAVVDSSVPEYGVCLSNGLRAATP